MSSINRSAYIQGAAVVLAAIIAGIFTMDNPFNKEEEDDDHVIIRPVKNCNPLIPEGQEGTRFRYVKAKCPVKARMIDANCDFGGGDYESSSEQLNNTNGYLCQFKPQLDNVKVCVTLQCEIIL